MRMPAASVTHGSIFLGSSTCASGPGGGHSARGRKTWDGTLSTMASMGYLWWGPIDIVSAGTGEMRKRYGFVYVDRDNEGRGTMRRSKKDSFAYYRDIIDTNREAQ